MQRCIPNKEFLYPNKSGTRGDGIEQMSRKHKACRVGLLVVAGGDRTRKRDEAGDVWRTMTKRKFWLEIKSEAQEKLGGGKYETLCAPKVGLFRV